jgi:hypothetical protein
MRTSPTPWRWVDRHSGDNKDCGGIVDANGVEVCNFGNRETYYPRAGEEPSQENIQMLLDAVNNWGAPLDDCY